jgi:hypothetical protein
MAWVNQLVTLTRDTVIKTKHLYFSWVVFKQNKYLTVKLNQSSFLAFPKLMYALVLKRSH